MSVYNETVDQALSVIKTCPLPSREVGSALSLLSRKLPQAILDMHYDDLEKAYKAIRLVGDLIRARRYLEEL